MKRKLERAVRGPTSMWTGLFILFMGVLIFHIEIANGAPNEFGETGLVEQPLASTLSARQAVVILGMRYYDFSGKGDFRAAPVGFSFGVARNAEVGLALASYSENDVIYPGVEQSLRLQFRWRFISDVDGYPAVAVSVWGDNLMGVPGAGGRLIAQKQTDGFQIMAQGGYLYQPDRSFAICGIGFEHQLVDGIDVLLDVNYSYPTDQGVDQRLRGFPGVRWFISPRFAIIGTIGGGLDGNETVVEGFAGISFLSYEGRKVRRARPEILPGEVPEEVPEIPEIPPYSTPRPQFKLRIPPAELPGEP